MTDAIEQAGGGERKGERTRRRILEAGRRVFGEVGYDRATIRAIAAEAQVDKSSVIQYFGTKEQLFRAALDLRIDVDALTVDGDPAASAESYLRAMLERWAADSPMAVLLRTSLTSEEAADLLRRHITAEAIDRIALHVEGPDPRLRAALAGAVMFGITFHRHLLRTPDLAGAPLDDVLRLAVPLIRDLLAPPPTKDPDDPPPRQDHRTAPHPRSDLPR
ncbi:TetR/AcrR family transcriptional regulator [Nonomuraea jabiensis]|uniref:AcrR family transcriptional regulator n=1 Tax=Nonomuraea jabiensis TaxID=882448 RepID=A0A7W9GFV0_9ACTN|nr:TetR family transcriptional regulator [Nonomuraea jabiensis]MBB5783062.1 AcrR family transcriptional regulator [Nonomuraea jabiensis]